MTKKEQVEFNDLRNERDLALALRWTKEVSLDVDPPDSFSDSLSVGWSATVYGNSVNVEQGCSSTINHATGRIDKTTSQGARKFYSSKLRALRAARYQAERQAAKQLLSIDKMIQYEEDRFSSHAPQTS